MAARVLLAMALARSAAAVWDSLASVGASVELEKSSAAVSGADRVLAVAWLYRDAQCNHVAKENQTKENYTKECQAVDGGGSEKGVHCGFGKYVYKYYNDSSDCEGDRNGELRTLDLGECRGPDPKGHYVTIACGPPPPPPKNIKAIVTFYSDDECEHHAPDAEHEVYELDKCYKVDDVESEIGLSCSNGTYKYMYYNHSSGCNASDGNGTLRSVGLGECHGPDSKGNYVKVACDSRVLNDDDDDDDDDGGGDEGEGLEVYQEEDGGAAVPPKNIKAIVTFYSDDECEHYAPDTEHDVYKLNKCYKVDDVESEIGVSCSNGTYEYMYYNRSSGCNASDGNGTLRSIGLGECHGPDPKGNYVKVACDSSAPNDEGIELYREDGGAAVPRPGLPAGGALALLAVVGGFAARAARWRRAPPAADEESLVA